MFLILATGLSLCSIPEKTIEIEVTPSRVKPGDTVKVEVRVFDEEGPASSLLEAMLIKPTLGSFELALEKVQNNPGVYKGEVIITDDAPEGIYGLHVWTGNLDKPEAVGKASFLFGKMVVDFTYPSTLEGEDTDFNISQYSQSFLEDRLFDKVEKANFYPINSEAKDPDEECRRYAALLDEAPIDIMNLGTGESGHLAFIDPPYCDFDDPEMFKVTEIDDESREQMVHDGCFEKMEDVPKIAYTMTVPACHNGLFTIIIVPTALKAKAIKGVVEGPITTGVPASILQTKENSWLMIDTDSGQLLSKS